MNHNYYDGYENWHVSTESLTDQISTALAHRRPQDNHLQITIAFDSSGRITCANVSAHKPGGYILRGGLHHNTNAAIAGIMPESLADKVLAEAREWAETWAPEYDEENEEDA